jgi:hypothetical protein
VNVLLGQMQGFLECCGRWRVWLSPLWRVHLDMQVSAVCWSHRAVWTVAQFHCLIRTWCRAQGSERKLYQGLWCVATWVDRATHVFCGRNALLNLSNLNWCLYTPPAFTFKTTAFCPVYVVVSYDSDDKLRFYP